VDLNGKMQSYESDFDEKTGRIIAVEVTGRHFTLHSVNQQGNFG
jgi:hypothetical protein